MILGKSKAKKIVLSGTIQSIIPFDHMQNELVKKYGQVHGGQNWHWEWNTYKLQSASIEDLLQIINLIAPSNVYDLAVKISEL